MLIERASIGVLSPLLQGSMMTDSSDDAEDLSPPKPVADDEKKSTGTAKQNKEQAEKERKEAEVLQAEVPEVDVYIQLLVALFLFDRGLKEEVTKTTRHMNHGAPKIRCCGSSAHIALPFVATCCVLQSVSLLSTLFTSLSTFNRRSLDPLSAKIYSFYALVCESTGKDAEIRKSDRARSMFVAMHTLSIAFPERDINLFAAVLPSILFALLFFSANSFSPTALRACSTTSPARRLCPCASFATIFLTISTARPTPSA